MKVIVNTNVILEDSVLFDGVVAIKDGIIQAVTKKDELVIPPNAEVIDANGLFTAPGLIDIHNHGSINNFFIEDTRECCEYFIKHGQTSVYPTFYSTCTAQEMIDGAKKLKDFSQTHELGQMIKGAQPWPASSALLPPASAAPWPPSASSSASVVSWVSSLRSPAQQREWH